MIRFQVGLGGWIDRLVSTRSGVLGVADIEVRVVLKGGLINRQLDFVRPRGGPRPLGVTGDVVTEKSRVRKRRKAGWYLRAPGRREPSADANCSSPRSPHALDDASLDELRCEWRRLYRSEPPRISRDLLIRGVGYRRQEIQQGGLGKSTRRKLKTLAKMFRTEGQVAPDPGLSLKPGARLVREWHGRTHTVTVTEDGFEYGGTTYRSLTKIAKKITGAHWSGPSFFGLVRPYTAPPTETDNG